MRVCSLALFSLTLTGIQAELPPSSNIQVDMNSHWMIDETGRTRVFHGINQVQKVAPFYPAQLLDDARIAYFVEWGFNVVRLGTQWSPTQPTENTYNLTYVGILKSIVEKLDAAGIYVILDMHQDVLAERFGVEYDGVPGWLLDSFPATEHPYPYPFSSVNDITHWAQNYLTYAAQDAYKDIYANVSGAVEQCGNFWKLIAQEFKDYKNVLGYELINEPYPGNTFTDPDLLIPGIAGRQVLQPFYEELASKIREIDDEKMIFYEPVTWGVLSDNEFVGPGFTQVPGGDSYKDRSVFSYHYYCWALDIDKNIFLQKFCEWIFLPNVVDAVFDYVTDIGGSFFLTEFGLCDGEHIGSVDYDECQGILEKIDEKSQSWTYWDSNFFWGDGSVRLYNVNMFSRPYAMATAGTPRSSSFDVETKAFEYSYKSANIAEPTIIYIPPAHYSIPLDASRISSSSGLTIVYNDTSYIYAYSSSVQNAWVQISKASFLTPSFVLLLGFSFAVMQF